jgi:hypothetical protein
LIPAAQIDIVARELVDFLCHSLHVGSESLLQCREVVEINL